MNRTIAVALGLAASVVVPIAAAEVTFYSQEGFHGRTFTVGGTVDNFGDFNDRASSVVVQRGRWELCEDAYFRGRCTVLRPGQYPSLAAVGLDNRVSSIRRMRGNPQYVASPPPAPPYDYYPRHGERLYDANVVAVRAVLGPPERRCWVEQQSVVRRDPNVPGAIVGGILGGVIGHQIGSGRGNDVATAIGAIGGAAVGANVNRRDRVYTQDVQRCADVPGSAQPAYWDVTYVFRGQTHRAQLSYAPGPTIAVNRNGEPRV
jgi:uncharacterized protein YcfJ